jgi:hypothetical protein
MKSGKTVQSNPDDATTERRNILRLAAAVGAGALTGAMAGCISTNGSSPMPAPQLAAVHELAERIVRDRAELRAFGQRAGRMATQLERGVSLQRATTEFSEAYPPLRYGGSASEPASAIVVIIIIILVLLPLAAS